MKKGIIVLTTSLMAFNMANAQLSKGGFPWSINKNIPTETVLNINEYSLPNWQAYLEQESANSNKFAAPLVALFAQSDISFPSSGTFTTLDNGDKIWRTQVQIKDAPGMGFYFDQFHLPKGVNFFITNKNLKHTLGAYTELNNNEFNNFATEPIQGGFATLEINIPAGVQENDIKLHIDKVAVYFRSYDNLQAYTDNYNPNLRTLDAYDDALFKSSSVCTINSICPEGDAYPNQRKSTLQQLLMQGMGVGACSGTMITTTANTEANCEQYYLTASHCEPSGSSRTDATFSQLLLRFQFESATCANGSIPQSKTLTGAKFVSRSTVNNNNPQSINGDFLLLKPNNTVPSSWGVLLNGWDANSNINTTATANKPFINFSHPAGDMKKVMVSENIVSATNGGPDSHWEMTIAPNKGVAMQGSSGSSLINPNEKVIGVASVATESFLSPIANNCRVNGLNENIQPLNVVYFSKLSVGWEYGADGGAANTQLKPWLDPNNSGTKVTNTVTTECKAVTNGGNTSINTMKNIDDQVQLFPNPNNTGKLNIGFNLTEKVADLKLEVYDIHGRILKFADIPAVQNSNYEIDLSNLSNGVYQVRIYNSNTSTSKKVVLNK